MRNIVNISLPPEMVKMIKNEVKTGEYASVSEFIRHLLRMWKNHQLIQTLAEGEKAFREGKAKELKSLKDLR